MLRHTHSPTRNNRSVAIQQGGNLANICLRDATVLFDKVPVNLTNMITKSFKSRGVFPNEFLVENHAGRGFLPFEKSLHDSLEEGHIPIDFHLKKMGS